MKSVFAIKVPNYCGDWSLTGPLMIDNAIDLELIPPIREIDNKKGYRTTWSDEIEDVLIEAADQNPLRAIATCFLKMKAEENGSV